MVTIISNQSCYEPTETSCQSILPGYYCSKVQPRYMNLLPTILKALAAFVTCTSISIFLVAIVFLTSIFEVVENTVERSIDHHYVLFGKFVSTSTRQKQSRFSVALRWRFSAIESYHLMPRENHKSSERIHPWWSFIARTSTQSGR